MRIDDESKGEKQRKYKYDVSINLRKRRKYFIKAGYV